jgi:hypothetical protein
MIENEDKKYIRYTAAGKEFHMYSNAYDVVSQYKDKPDTRFRSTQIYVESYDRDFYVKIHLNYSTLTASLDCIQYAPKCNLTEYFFDHKDLHLFQYLAAALQLVRAEFPQFHTIEVRDELTLRTSEQSMRHAYLYLSYFIAALYNGETWFERYFKATPRYPDDNIEKRQALFSQKPDLNDLISNSFHIEYDWMPFLEKYYPVCASSPTLHDFVKVFANRRDFDTLAYWYPAYARRYYQIPYGLTLPMANIPGASPYYKITEISTVHPLIVPLSDDYKYYGYSVEGTDDEILVINEGLSTMKFSMADIEDD